MIQVDAYNDDIESRYFDRIDLYKVCIICALFDFRNSGSQSNMNNKNKNNNGEKCNESKAAKRRRNNRKKRQRDKKKKLELLKKKVQKANKTNSNERNRSSTTTNKLQSKNQPPPPPPPTTKNESKNAILSTNDLDDTNEDIDVNITECDSYALNKNNNIDHTNEALIESINNIQNNEIVEDINHSEGNNALLLSDTIAISNDNTINLHGHTNQSIQEDNIHDTSSTNQIVADGLNCLQSEKRNEDSDVLSHRSGDNSFSKQEEHQAVIDNHDDDNGNDNDNCMSSDIARNDLNLMHSTDIEEKQGTEKMHEQFEDDEDYNFIFNILLSIILFLIKYYPQIAQQLIIDNVMPKDLFSELKKSNLLDSFKIKSNDRRNMDNDKRHHHHNNNNNSNSKRTRSKHKRKRTRQRKRKRINVLSKSKSKTKSESRAKCKCKCKCNSKRKHKQKKKSKPECDKHDKYAQNDDFVQKRKKRKIMTENDKMTENITKSTSCYCNQFGDGYWFCGFFCVNGYYFHPYYQKWYPERWLIDEYQHWMKNIYDNNVKDGNVRNRKHKKNRIRNRNHAIETKKFRNRNNNHYRDRNRKKISSPNWIDLSNDSNIAMNAKDNKNNHKTNTNNNINNNVNDNSNNDSNNDASHDLANDDLNVDIIDLANNDSNNDASHDLANDNNNNNNDTSYDLVYNVTDNSNDHLNVDMIDLANDDEEGLPALSSLQPQKKRKLKPHILNYVNEKRKGWNNIFNGYINFQFDNGAFNKNNLINGKLAVIYVEEYYLNKILKGEKTLEIRKYTFEKWRNKWIGITCKSNLIYGQVFITGSTKYDKNTLLGKDLIKQHCIKNEDDQHRFIESAKGTSLYAWKIKDFERFPSPLQYVQKNTGAWKYRNVKPETLSVAYANDVYIDRNSNVKNQSHLEDSYILPSSPLSSPPASMLLSSSSSSSPPDQCHRYPHHHHTDFLWNTPPRPIPEAHFSFPDLDKLKIRIKHQQILDYEELDVLISALTFYYNNKNGNQLDDDCFENIIHDLLYTAIQCIQLVPRIQDIFGVNKWEWEHPHGRENVLLDDMNCISFKDIIKKWIHETPLISENYQDVYNQLISRLRDEYNDHCMKNHYIGPTKPYTSTTKDWERQKCPDCYRQHRWSALSISIRCAICADKANSRCSNCIIAAGINSNVPICSQCARTDYLISDGISIDDVPSLKGLRIAQSLNTTNVVLLQFIPEQTQKNLYCKSVLVKDRFIEFKREELQSILGDRYQELLQEFINRPKNVVFEDYDIDLQRGLNEYLDTRGGDKFFGEDIRKYCNWNFTKSIFTIKISSIGPLKYNGHVVAQGLSNFIIDKNEFESKAVIEYDNLFPDEDESIEDNDIATKYCHAVHFKPQQVAILGLMKSYKGKGTCWNGLTYNEDLQKKMLQHGTNRLLLDANGKDGYYWTDETLKKLQNEVDWEKLEQIRLKGEKRKYLQNILSKEPMLKVVDSTDVKAYLDDNHNELLLSMRQYELLSNILAYTIATQIPQLKPAFYQHIQYDDKLRCPYPHGSWYGNKDFIKYWQKTKVNAHVDHEELVQEGFYHPGPYIIWKLIKNGEKVADQILCSVSNKASGCEYDRSKPNGDRDHGGHVRLTPGTVYWMFDEGAVGGISHSIHNAEEDHDLWSSELYGGFKSKSYTLVMRPYLLEDQLFLL